MTSAQYGRMRLGGCLEENHGHVGCKSDVITHMDKICSGLHNCVMDIPDGALQNYNACPKELILYLEASYECLKGKKLNKW